MYQISHLNINDDKFKDNADVDLLLIDPVYTCNLHCLYCHNPRDKGRIEEKDLQNFIDKKINSVNILQIGCAMEPTMDKRLVQFATLISKSKARPSGRFSLQTNGTLLHKHDLFALTAAGVSHFSISFDSVDSDIHKRLRGNSDLNVIKNNIANVAANHPDVSVTLMCTVNKINFDDLEAVCSYAQDNNIKIINFRKMFYYPTSQIISDHSTMSDIDLDNQAFLDRVSLLKNKFNTRIQINCYDAQTHETTRERVIK